MSYCSCMPLLHHTPVSIGNCSSCMPLLHHAPISIGNCSAILLLYTSVTSHSPLYRLLLRIVSVPISSILLFHIVLVCLLHNAPLSIDCCYVLFLYPSLPYCCFILFLYACYITLLSLYETAVPYCFCTHLFHTTVSCCSTRPSLYETAVPYCSCSCMPLLHHVPLSVRDCCIVLFLYATVTSRSPLCTRLLYRIVPVCHCYITFPTLYETAVPYCSCMPLLHHAPLSIRNRCAVLFLFLYATVTSRPPLYTKPLCRIVPVPVCHCYITRPSIYEIAQSYS